VGGGLAKKVLIYLCYNYYVTKGAHFHKKVLSEALVLCLLVFFILFCSVITTGLFHTIFSNLDFSFAQFLAPFQSELGAKFFLFFTYLGNWEVIFTVEACVLLGFLVFHHRQDITLFLLATFVGEGVSLIFKAVASRERPADGLLTLTGADSFPSGHALMAILFYGLITYFLVIATKNKKYKKSITIGAVILVFLIGFSRLYLGVHYLTDVLAGFALGGIFLCCFVILFEKTKHAHLFHFHRSPKEKKDTDLVRLVLFGLIILEVFFIGYFYITHPLPSGGVVPKNVILAS
jgi:membrane-associated phospholipid phosphatase